MKFFNSYAIALLFAVASCTVDKTDYEAEISTVITEHYEFKEAAAFNSGGYIISIEALNGTFYKGYNEIRLRIFNTLTNESVPASEVTFLPVFFNTDGSKTSCPHQYNLEYHATEKYYLGYSVFTNESNNGNNWKLYISFSDGDQVHTVNQEVSIQQQTNKNLNMTTFTGNDGEQYCIALVSPQKPRVAENQLVAGIYKYNQPTNPEGNFPDPTQFSYTPVNHFKLKLDPRMPEPSMGNHSSPNNQDLTQQANGLYYGIVNYTMTGNWTLNLILINQNGQIIKGTVVPTDFTPGVQGAKSQLYIDTLF